MNETSEGDNAPHSKTATEEVTAQETALTIARAGAEDTPGTSPSRAALGVIVVGLVITLGVVWTAWTLDGRNEHRLLEVQTHQAAEVLSSAILGLRNPLETSLQVETVTGGDPALFSSFGMANVGPGKPFASAVLWRHDGASWHQVTSVGPPAFLPTPAAAALVAKAASSPTLVVMPTVQGIHQRVAYAVADMHHPTFAVYAERAIPANRVASVESNAAFADLDFATYLGRSTTLAALATTDVPLADLPIAGGVRTTIQFGDSSIVLITAARGHLGGTLGGDLPWMFLAGGVLLTAATAVVATQLARRRRAAENDAHTIAGLYETVNDLYGEQRSIAETLQRALIPQRNPDIPELQIATRYVPGAHGVEIGGDWFSLVEIDDGRFGFVVGDVSGKGIGAAAIMARLRFTIRAYLIEGHPPDKVLSMCSRQLNVNRDGHLCTVLVGTGDLDSGSLLVANAGHLDPLLITDDGAGFVHTVVGLPLGVRPTTYSATAVNLPPGASFVGFTDGLVERRGESIDLGLDRVQRIASTAEPGIEALVSSLLGSVVGADDDIAVLAFARLPAPEEGKAEAVAAHAPTEA